MKNINIKWFCLLLSAIALFSSCKKDWLNAKPNESLVVPTSVANYQALLDNEAVMNTRQPGLQEVSADDFYLSYASYQGISLAEMSAYLWADTKGFYGGQASADWLYAYARILNENVTLDGISSLKSDAASQAAYNNVKGSALFYRSLDFFNLAQEFCKDYSGTTANTDLGLPLRTSSNVNLIVNRSSVQQTYDQIINDLLKATPMLPVKPLYPTRPSKPAAYGLLARIYLSQENYSKALLYADSCLQLYPTLLDFNTLKTAAANPIARFNKEVIFHYTLSGYASFRTTRLIVDPILYSSYTSNDLRKSIYFLTVSGNISYKGSYDGDLVFFGGLATDEMYLIRAECYARAGNTTNAMNDLSTLLQTRWKSGTYTAMTAGSPDAALSLILNERRKELCFRGLRWTDLRRLNNDSRFQTTIVRNLNGQTYTLLPNSPKYVLPIDDIEILLGGLQQNPR